MPAETKSLEKSAKAPARETVGAASAHSGTAATLLAGAGNLALQRVAAPRLQRRSHLRPRGDLYEEEADRVSQQVLTLVSASTVQRKCACGGEGECDECQRKAAEQSAAIQRKTDDLSVQRFSLGEDAPGAADPSSTAGNPPANADPSTPAASPGLIVEDNVTDLGSGQMKKSEFLGQLRSPVRDAAQSALQGTMWSSLGSVAIEPWFQYYSGQRAGQLERSIQQSTPGSAGVTAATAYIPLVSSQVQSSVSDWARTGKVPPGAPTGLPGMDSAGSVAGTIGSAISDVAQGAKDVASSIGSGISNAAQSVGDTLSNVGGMLFKAKDGGAQRTDDPRAIQSQLGTGESLDGSLESRMSSAFGYDFSSVRVHKDNRAAQLSTDLNARAFTIGSNVAFGTNEYQPGTLIGDALIAHELAHVVQQGEATAQTPLPKGESETGALEEDADFSAVRAVASLWTGAESGLANISRNAIPALRSGLRLTRCAATGPTVKPTPSTPLPAVPTSPGQGGQLSPEKLVVAGHASCNPETGKMSIKINYDTFPLCMADCVFKHEQAHVAFGQDKCSKIAAAYKIVMDAFAKVDSSKSQSDLAAAEKAVHAYQELIDAYAATCAEDEKQAYQAGIDSCSSAQVKKQCDDLRERPQYEQNMRDMVKFRDNPPNCPQRKSLVSAPGDGYEGEADRVSQGALSRISSPTLQRKCACGGEGECDECRRKAAAQSAIIRGKTDDLAVQRAPSGEEAPGTTTPTSTTGNAANSGPAAAPASSPVLIVEDNLTDLGAGQMKKSEFLGQLRSPVSTAAVAGLQGTVWSSMGAVAIEPWFQYYSRQSAQQLERTIQQSVPGSAGITSASAYIPLVSSRVQSAVGEWARTGKVPPGVPAGLPGIGLPGAGVLDTVSSLAQSAGDVLSNVGSAIGGAISDVAQGAKDVVSSIGSGISSLAQGAGNALSSIGDALFKAKEGGARNLDDPRAIQSQLGAGESLDGTLQSGMSSAFGYDFSGVRVHKDNRAAQLSSDLNARAFTIGNNVAFGASEYQPGSLAGDALIAHELAHVVQQGGATEQAPLQKGEESTGALEHDADNSAVRAVTSIWSSAKSGLANVRKNAIPALKSGLKLQRCGPKPSPPPVVPPTFDQYRDRFNALWNAAPFSAMPAADAAFDPTLDSRGPRTRKARAIFTKILADDPTMAAAYTPNAGGIRDHIDTFVGPEGLNLIASPRLDALKNALNAYPHPVATASYAAFRGAVAAAAGALTSADRDAIEQSNDWQRLINDSVTSETNRADIRSLISPPPAPGATTGPTPAQRTHFLSAWRPHLSFWDGQRLTTWSAASTVRYHAGGQNFRVNAQLPVPETNPGLSLYVRGQILRGAAPLFAPAPQVEFPPGQNASPQIPMPILAPAAVPAGGDPLSFDLTMLEPGAAGVMAAVGTKSIHAKVRRELAYTQAQAEAKAAVDEAYLHDTTAAGLLGKMTARGGIAANVAADIAAGKIILHALTVRHDSAAFVAAAGAPNPNLEGYFMGPTYATRSFTQVLGAGGFSLGTGEIVVNRTADVPTSAMRSDDEVIMFVVHESVHHMDFRLAASTDLERYKTEFRAYWMDGRYGPPNSPTCPGAPAGCYSTAYDPAMAPPGPKSPRARVIFDHLYGSASYPFVRPAYDNNTGGFREQVDNYLIPDGINLSASGRLDALRSLIEGWSGVDFPAFRIQVQAFMGVGPAPAAGVLTADERDDISHERAWRDLVERKVTDPTQQSQIKGDLRIHV